MRAAVVVFPGSNCDRDARDALRLRAGVDPVMHWHRDPELPAADLIVVPGGFSYGDYLRPGAMAARSPAMREVAARAARGVAVLGICNGFQILAECGLLPGALMRNAGMRFVCRDVALRVETADAPLLGGYVRGQVVRLGVAHGDGNYHADDATLAALEDEDRIAFRYCDRGGDAVAAANPNGSARNIAGVLGRGRNVLGMMPHPERAVDPILGGVDGAPLFASLAAALAGR